MVLKIAVPDLISNSYFPAVATVELGLLAEKGLDSKIELIFPVSKAYAALRDGVVDCVAGSAHSALSAFQNGEESFSALSAGCIGFGYALTSIRHVAISALSGRIIGAAPWLTLASSVCWSPPV